MTVISDVYFDVAVMLSKICFEFKNNLTDPKVLNTGETGDINTMLYLFKVNSNTIKNTLLVMSRLTLCYLSMIATQ